MPVAHTETASPNRAGLARKRKLGRAASSAECDRIARALPCGELSTVKMAGAVSSIVVWRKPDWPEGVSTAIWRGVPDGSVGHRNSTWSVDVDRTGAYASFTSTRVPPRLPLRPDRSVKDASPLKRNQPEIAATAPGLHTAPPATLRNCVTTGAPVPTYTTTDLLVRAPSASVAMNEISCFPTEVAEGVQSKAPMFASNTDPGGKPAAVIDATPDAETWNRTGVAGVPAALLGARRRKPEETTDRVSRTVLPPAWASRVALSSVVPGSASTSKRIDV